MHNKFSCFLFCSKFVILKCSLLAQSMLGTVTRSLLCFEVNKLLVKLCSVSSFLYSENNVLPQFSVTFVSIEVSVEFYYKI